MRRIATKMPTGLLAGWMLIAALGGCIEQEPIVARLDPEKQKGGNTHEAAPENNTPSELAALREAILANMPTNSEKRCVGISVVVEALLDGDRLKDSDHEQAEKIANRIYDQLLDGRPLRYHTHVLIDGEGVPIDSSEAIETLCTLVTDRYKQDYRRLIETDAGRRKLDMAGKSFIATSNQLDRILDLDPDKTDVFFGSGRRLFPDGTIDDTYHAFLISKTANGDKFVYDSNSPGAPIPCQITDHDDGVTIKWRCRFQTTGKITTQTYRIVHKDTFFGVIHQ
jgi:hypothetical protein